MKTKERQGRDKSGEGKQRRQIRENTGYFSPLCQTAEPQKATQILVPDKMYKETFLLKNKTK